MKHSIYRVFAALDHVWRPLWRRCPSTTIDDIRSSLLLPLLTVALSVGSVTAGVDSALCLAGGFLLLHVVLAGRASAIIFRRSRDISEARDEALAVVRDARLDQTTHGPPQNALRAVVSFALDAGGSAAREAEVLANLDRRLSDAGQKASRGVRPDTASIATAAVDALRDNPNLQVRRYREAICPVRLRGTRVGSLLEQVGGVLDDVRTLHNVEIERAVLLLTFWSRFLLLALAPMLGGITSVRVPLDGPGVAWSDVPWFVALLVAAGTAFRARDVADGIMERSEAGARLRRRLSVIEAPIVVSLCLTNPAWTVCLFASGWHNYMHRPDFSWLRLAALVVLLVVLQGVGLALLGIGVAPASLEIGITLLAILVTGGSYGAMFPITLVVLVDSIFTGSSGRYRVVQSAREDLVSAADSLDRLAVVFGHMKGEAEQAARVSALEAAHRLRNAVDLIEVTGVVPRTGLRDLVLATLERRDFALLLSDAPSEPDQRWHSGPRFRLATSGRGASGTGRTARSSPMCSTSCSTKRRSTESVP